MSIAALRQLLKTPERTTRASQRTWNRATKTFGLEIPHDYHDFINEFGGVTIDEFLLVYSPFAKGEHVNLWLGTLEEAAQVRRSRATRGSGFPIGAFPEPNGLVYWGRTWNGDMLGWDCAKELRSIVVYDDNATTFKRYHMSMTEFLARLLTRRVVVPFFPDNFPTDPHSCVPNE